MSSSTINVGGEKVRPAEVEKAIFELGFVRDVVVPGQPHPLLGQVVVAPVALRFDATNRTEAAKHIRLHCRRQLAADKCR